MNLIEHVLKSMEQPKQKLADVFHLFYQEHAEKIFKFVYYKVGSRELAEDIASETFLKTWRYIEKNTVENIRAFVYHVANNLIVDHWRSKLSLAKPRRSTKVGLSAIVLTKADSSNVHPTRFADSARRVVH